MEFGNLHLNTPAFVPKVASIFEQVLVHVETVRAKLKVMTRVVQVWLQRRRPPSAFDRARIARLGEAGPGGHHSPTHLGVLLAEAQGDIVRGTQRNTEDVEDIGGMARHLRLPVARHLLVILTEQVRIVLRVAVLGLRMSAQVVAERQRGTR